MNDVSPPVDDAHVTALGSSVASDLFQILRDGRPRTRTELSAMTGLARSTVALRIDALMNLGLVGPVGDAVSTGGRPSSQFAITASGRVVLGGVVGLACYLGLVPFHSDTLQFEGIVRRHLEIMTGAGIVAGVVYWLIAGRSAGPPRETTGDSAAAKST